MLCNNHSLGGWSALLHTQHHQRGIVLVLRKNLRRETPALGPVAYGLRCNSEVYRDDEVDVWSSTSEVAKLEQDGAKPSPRPFLIGKEPCSWPMSPIIPDSFSLFADGLSFFSNTAVIKHGRQPIAAGTRSTSYQHAGTVLILHPYPHHVETQIADHAHHPGWYKGRPGPHSSCSPSSQPLETLSR